MKVKMHVFEFDGDSKEIQAPLAEFAKSLGVATQTPIHSNKGARRSPTPTKKVTQNTTQAKLLVESNLPLKGSKGWAVAESRYAMTRFVTEDELTTLLNSSSLKATLLDEAIVWMVAQGHDVTTSDVCNQFGITKEKWRTVMNSITGSVYKKLSYANKAGQGLQPRVIRFNGMKRVWEFSPFFREYVLKNVLYNH